MFGFLNREPTSVCLCGPWASWSLLFLSLSYIKKLIKLFLISYRKNSLPWQGDGVLIYSQNEKTFDAGICIKSRLFPIFFSSLHFWNPQRIQEEDQIWEWLKVWVIGKVISISRVYQHILWTLPWGHIQICVHRFFPCKVLRN